MDDDNRVRIIKTALIAGLLIFLGAGCTGEQISGSGIDQNFLDAIKSSEIKFNSDIFVNTTTSTNQPAVETFRRTCDLSWQDVTQLLQDQQPARLQALSGLQDLISGKEKDGWKVSQLCLDRDVWVSGERDDVYTAYFSMAKNSDGGMDQIVAGYVTSQADDTGVSKIYVSDSIKEETQDIGNPKGFNTLDLQKHYGNDGQVLPTVVARYNQVSVSSELRQTYTLSTGTKQLKKIFECRIKNNPENMTIISDTCKNKID